MKINKYLQKLKVLTKSFLKDPLFLRRWESPWYPGKQKDNQLSVRIMARRRRQVYPYHGDSYMFIQDMYTGIMPFMTCKGEREKYPIKIKPSSFEKEKLIADGVANRDSSRFLSDALCDFVRTTAQVLFQDGVALYEIVYKKNAGGEIESFDLELLQPFYLFKVLNNYYQFVPWWEAKESHERVQLIKIPAEKMLRIDFPRQLGGIKKIKKVLKRLYDLSKEVVPKFQMDVMANNKNIGFDLNEFNRSKFLEIAILTKNFGWNQRQFSKDNITEYYSMLRFLREKKVEATVRGKIISKLNEVLNRPPLSLGTNIIIENIFTSKDVDEQKKILEKGEVKFIDIFNALKI